MHHIRAYKSSAGLSFGQCPLVHAQDEADRWLQDQMPKRPCFQRNEAERARQYRQVSAAATVEWHSNKYSGGNLTPEAREAMAAGQRVFRNPLAQHQGRHLPRSAIRQREGVSARTPFRLLICLCTIAAELGRQDPCMQQRCHDQTCTTVAGCFRSEYQPSIDGFVTYAPFLREAY